MENIIRGQQDLEVETSKLPKNAKKRNWVRRNWSSFERDSLREWLEFSEPITEQRKAGE